jgi:uncharacterized protein
LDRTDQLKAMVEKRCRNAHFYSDTARVHLYDVGDKARSLAKRVGADEEICWLAGFLHDIAAIDGGPDDHHIIGARIAGEILRELSYPENTVKAVQYCILVHRGSSSLERETIEAKVVASADAISHFERVDELIRVARNSLGKNPEEAIGWVRKKLERSWNKLMPEAKAMAQKPYDAALKVISD